MACVLEDAARQHVARQPQLRRKAHAVFAFALGKPIASERRARKPTGNAARSCKSPLRPREKRRTAVAPCVCPASGLEPLGSVVLAIRVFARCPVKGGGGLTERYLV